jgi:hypothetical protein
LSQFENLYVSPRFFILTRGAILMTPVKATVPFEPYLNKNSMGSLMDQRTFSVVAGVIFAAVALLHLVRIYMGWPVMIGGWSVPMWVS